MKILFVNSCVRGKEISRSYKIAEEFINAIRENSPLAEITEIDLMKINPPYMTYENFSKREELISKGKLEHSMFDLAKQFVEADRIVIAAPYWEFSFPAILKAYIENVSVAGLAFKYTETGSVGLCNAKKMMYITTRGGFATGEFAAAESGASYLKTLCTMYGINKFDAIAAEGMDIWGADVDLKMADAVEEAKKAANKFVLD